MLQEIEADLNEDYINTKLDRSCGGAEPSVLQAVANSSSMYRTNSPTDMSETVQSDKSMLEKKTARASHSHNKKQVNETMEHPEINKWPNLNSMCKSYMQL